MPHHGGGWRVSHPRAPFFHRIFFTSRTIFEILNPVGRTQTRIPKLEGLKVRVDELLYMPALETPPERPHPFAYFISIENQSDREVTLVGRKWIVRQESGGTLVVEGSGVVGKTPRLAIGDTFSYNSYHAVGAHAEVSGGYLFQDDHGNVFAARVPDYHLEIPLWGV
ncbi:MAG: ApaG domain [Verrucomicrobiae bacterium]|nr:ApaG domain [Verrucomicrobiae bacterium]MCB1086443.1 ApaG domain [Verrucomicrobiae bacterium]